MKKSSSVKKIEPIELSRSAQLMGTISRIYGVLRLEAKENTMDGRWEAVEEWCKEREAARQKLL